MKIFNLIPKQLKPAGYSEFHTSAEHKHDQSDGCEFLDEAIHMHDELLEDPEFGEY